VYIRQDKYNPIEKVPDLLFSSNISGEGSLDAEDGVSGVSPSLCGEGYYKSSTKSYRQNRLFLTKRLFAKNVFTTDCSSIRFLLNYAYVYYI